ncbi:hypothetical protein TWF696_009243 [Orbilia brochopaga]|uniref:Uncharacterized protein n=1 Tax=Orbilia brochopaga TaxID=3140254 RepID=A0AAV9UG51_9PEZI
MSGLYPAPTAPGYGAPSCDNYIVCPTCPLGYYCPSSPPSTEDRPTYYQSPSSDAVARTTSTYDWASYEQPTCADYIVCPTCPLGYYCPGSTAPETTPYYAASPTSPTTPQPYGQPTCSDYVVCPTCPLGYSCPSNPSTKKGPIYYYTTPAIETTDPGVGYYSKAPTPPSGGPNPYLPSTTYFIGLPTTTLVVAPTCSEYVLCPVCPSGYYCPAESPSSTPSSGPVYYYSSPADPGNPTPAVPSCDVYAFCPECELGYSCVVDTTTSPLQGYGGYATKETANPPMENPYPTYGATPSIDATYVSGSDSPGYGYATVPVPAVPTCANYVLCPTCPLGYYCASTVEPTFASSTKYGVVPTGIIESVYSTEIVPQSYLPPGSCPDVVRTVTVTKTRDIYRIYNTCGTDPYPLVSSFIVPTVTVTQCDTSVPDPIAYTSPVSEVPSSSDCLTCTPTGDAYYNLSSQTTMAPSPSDPYGSNVTEESTSCSFKPCDGGYYCATCPHQWYCPTPTDNIPTDTPYPPYA